MCKYCESPKLGVGQVALAENDFYVAQVDIDTPIGRRVDNGGTLRFFDNIEEFVIPIQYCPMCGRKLNATSGVDRNLKAIDSWLELSSLVLKKKIMDKMYPGESMIPREFIEKVKFDRRELELESWIEKFLKEED